MASSARGAMFVKAIDSSGIVKMENMLQVCSLKRSKRLEKQMLFRLLLIMHPITNLNLALKSICAPLDKSAQYDQCKWISYLVSEFEIVKCGRNQVCIQHHHGFTEDSDTVVEIKAGEVKQCIVDDLWWDSIDYHISFTKPIIDMFRKADTDSLVLHLVYDMWNTKIENVKKIIFDHEGIDIITVWESRRNKSNTPLHCMAHLLVPKYYCHAWLQDGCNGVPRISPHEDHEVSMNRSKCLKRLFPNQTDLRKVYAEYGAFSSGSNYFNRPHVIDAMFEEPLSWWGQSCQHLPLIAREIERNQLVTSRVEDLVFVHCNFRLLSRKSKEYKEGPTKYWDICNGDLFGIEGREMMELAQLSLDDLKMQTMTFDDDNESQQLVLEDSTN
ncbi:hypothetical protein ACSBR2_026971 [Camellia fascicularis]